VKQASVSILVPVYNEERTVGQVVAKLARLKFVTEIIAVNDGSSDGSLAKLQAVRSKKLKIIDRPANGGKTAAIRDAKDAATGDIIVIQDADLEYDPEEIAAVIEPLTGGYADVVYGSRFLVKKAARVLYYYHYLANMFLTTLSNLFTNHNMTDIETCYKAFRAPVLKHMELTSTGFGMDVEITAMVGALKARIYEVPISYYGRTYAEGKKIGMWDGIMAIWYIFKYNVQARLSGKRKAYLAKVREELAAG
jgi:glycosyltransferase involved in cell wall biosynthesis